MKASELLIYTFPAETFQGGLEVPDDPSPPHRSLEARTLSPLPHFFSLSTTVSRPEDQGRRGTCATFAMSAVAEFALNREISEQHLYFEAWNMAHGAEPHYAEDGTPLDAVAEVLATRGACAEEVWAYNPEPLPGNPAQGTPPTRVGAAQRYRISSYDIVDPPSPASSAVCATIYNERRPVVVTVPVLADAGWDAGFVIDVPRGDEFRRGWHAIVALGFNSRDRLAFVQNSWGPYWAVCGYAAVTFDYLDRYARTIAVLR